MSALTLLESFVSTTVSVILCLQTMRLLRMGAFG